MVWRSRPPRRANHAAFFSLLMGSPRKNGRLGDPALPSLRSNSFHVKHFHPKFLESPSLALRASVWRKELQVPQKPVRRLPGGCRIATPGAQFLRARSTHFPAEFARRSLPELQATGRSRPLRSPTLALTLLIPETDTDLARGLNELRIRINAPKTINGVSNWYV
jgi:hypothetical protein